MNRVQADLARFYEHEATTRRRGRPAGWRVAWLDHFVERLVDEWRQSVLDVGAGPATDARSFLEAGIRYTGIDLAVANAALAAEGGASVVAGSMFELPFADATFEAGWSMSTLMHVPADDVDAALQSICRVLLPGAPLMIGQWGGSLGDIESDHEKTGFPRLFSLRDADLNRELLKRHGAIERWGGQRRRPRRLGVPHGRAATAELIAVRHACG